MDHFEIGTRVYCTGRIQRPGLVIDVSDEPINGLIWRHCLVKWLDETTEKVLEFHLRDFTIAMEEHKRKYEKFLKLTERIDKLASK